MQPPNRMTADTERHLRLRYDPKRGRVKKEKEEEEEELKRIKKPVH
jgi:hypothetical protein